MCVLTSVVKRVLCNYIILWSVGRELSKNLSECEYLLLIDLLRYVRWFRPAA